MPSIARKVELGLGEAPTKYMAIPLMPKKDQIRRALLIPLDQLYIGAGKNPRTKNAIIMVAQMSNLKVASALVPEP